MPEKKIKILHLEDFPNDAALVERELKRSNLNFEKLIVDNKEDFIKALGEFMPDIILSDHSLPSFNSTEALEIVQANNLRIPFILVTGTVSDEFSAEIIKKGASDYLLKDRITRLSSAVISAIEKYRVENEREKYLEKVIASEALFKKAEHITHFGIWETNLATHSMKWSDEFFRILGYEVGEVLPSEENFLSSIYSEDLIGVNKFMKEVVEARDTMKMKFRVKDKDGSLRYVESEFSVERNEKNKPTRIIGFNRDITKQHKDDEEKTKMTNEIFQKNKNLEQFAYIVSHNLRAPVANIIGITEEFKSKTYSDEEKSIFFMYLFSSVKRLDEIIVDLNSILHLNQEITEKREEIFFSGLIEFIKLNILNLINKEKVEIITNFAEVKKIQSVKSYLHSIFQNLIVNSIKYKRQGVSPVIKINSEKKNGKIILTFVDNGMGIDLTKKGGEVFGLYKRFHLDIEGKGMGLFMVKQQVESLGGKIRVESVLDKGTMFIIEFPD